MNNFEDHIKRKLKRHSSPVDTNALWNSISEDIPKEEDRKKRGVFFLLLFGFGMTGGMVLMYFGTSSENGLASYFQEDTASPLLAEDIYYEKNMDSYHHDMMPNAFGYHVSDSGTRQPTVLSHIPPVRIYPTPITTLKANKGEKENSAATFASQGTVSPIKTEGTITELREVAAIPSSEWLAEISLLDAEVLAMNEEGIEKIFIGEYEETESEDTKKEDKKVKMALGFTSSYSSTKANFSTDLSKHKYYAVKRSKLEEGKGAMTLSGDFVLSFHNNMRFRTGVEYTRLSEVFSYYKRQFTTISTERPEETSSSSAFINRDENEGNNTPVSNNSGINVRQLDFQSTNKHHFIDIPLIVGYEIGKKKLSLLVETGINVNLRTSSEGSILLDDGSYTNLSETDPIFNKNIKMSTYSGLSLNYDLGNNTQLKVGGHLRFNPFSITRKDNVVKQKYRSTGIHIGILHQL